MKQLWAAFKAQSLFGKVAAITVLLVAIFLIVVAVSVIRDKIIAGKLTAKQAAAEKRISDLLAEREIHIARIEGLEKEIAVLEATKPANQQAAVDAAATIEAKTQEIAKEDERYKYEMEAADQPVDDCVRSKRICERAKSLGLFAADRPCPDCQPTQ